MALAVAQRGMHGCPVWKPIDSVGWSSQDTPTGGSRYQVVLLCQSIDQHGGSDWSPGVSHIPQAPWGSGLDSKNVQSILIRVFYT